MDDDTKLVLALMLVMGVVFLALIGWGVYAARNGQNYSMECLRVGKSIQYRTILGKDEAVKECR